MTHNSRSFRPFKSRVFKDAPHGDVIQEVSSACTAKRAIDGNCQIDPSLGKNTYLLLVEKGKKTFLRWTLSMFKLQ